MLQLCVTMFLGAFPVEDTVGLALESEYLIQDNWLPLSNPKLPKAVQFAEQYPKAAVRYPKTVQVSPGADRQLKNMSVWPLWPSNLGSLVYPLPWMILMNKSSMLMSSPVSLAKTSAIVKFKDKE